MKIKKDYMLHELGDENIVIPVGTEATKFNGMVRLNETGVFLWKQLALGATQDELVAAMLAEFQVDEATVTDAVAHFVALLEENQFLEG